MSIRAYRVIKIEYAQPNSFNLWHDDKLVEFFDREYQFFSRLDGDCMGIIDLPVKALECALEEVELDDETKESLKEDIEACREAGEEYVQYYCF